MWTFKSFFHRHAAGRRSARTMTNSPLRHGRPRPLRLEPLESRRLLAVGIDLLPAFDYLAGPGEVNDVVVSPSVPFASIQDDPGVTHLQPKSHQRSFSATDNRDVFSFNTAL